MADFALPSSLPRLHFANLEAGTVRSFLVAHGRGSDPDHDGFLKTFSNELAVRSARTMDIFLTTLIRATKGKLPDPFYVTLPKVVHPGQAAALHKLLNAFEKKKKLKANTIKVELMVETPQSIIGFDGSAPLRAMVDALPGRCTIISRALTSTLPSTRSRCG